MLLLLGDDVAADDELVSETADELELDAGSQRQSSTSEVVDVVSASVLVKGPLQVTVTSCTPSTV